MNHVDRIKAQLKSLISTVNARESDAIAAVVFTLTQVTTAVADLAHLTNQLPLDNRKSIWGHYAPLMTAVRGWAEVQIARLHHIGKKPVPLCDAVADVTDYEAHRDRCTKVSSHLNDRLNELVQAIEAALPVLPPVKHRKNKRLTELAGNEIMGVHEYPVDMPLTLRVSYINDETLEAITTQEVEL